MELLNKNIAAAEASETDSKLVTAVNSNDMTYLVPNEIVIDSLSSNICLNIPNENIMQTSNYSTDHLETNNSCKNNENEQNKIVYNGVAYFNMTETSESIEKKANNNVLLLPKESDVNESETFTELETVSNIQAENPDNKNSNNSRIDFDLENFFTNSLVTTSILNNSLNNDLNNMQQQYSDLSKQESNYYNYNNVTEDSISCGINNFKIFSLDTRF